VPFNLKTKGALKPLVKQEIFANAHGDIDEVLVDDGAMVKAGDVLVRMKNEELKIQAQDLSGKLELANKQVLTLTHRLLNWSKQAQRNEADKEQLQAQMGEAKQEVDTLTKQLQIKNEQLDKLTVKSPIDGQVITWDAKEHLARRPVQQGEVLMSVANLEGGWKLELYVPDRRAGKVKRAFKLAQAKNEKLPVNFILMSAPGTTLKGTVRDIEESTFVQEEEGPCVRVKVDLEKQPENARPNASLTASVNVGTCSFAYYWLHEAWEYLQANWLFF
jgi:multidrug efflux pump subunit AcrA (membrane-fusion protein)